MADRVPYNQPLRSIRYIGPYYADRAREMYGIRTQRDLYRYMRARTKQANREFMSEWLENARRGECVPPPKYRRNYSVRPANEYAFNAVVEFMRRSLPDTEHERIPARLRRRPVRLSHPRRCVV